MTVSTGGGQGQKAAGQPQVDPMQQLRDTMDRRLSVWYRKSEIHPEPALQKRREFLASLVNKSAMPKYIARMGFPMRERYLEAASIDEIDFAALPDRIVVKPNNAASSKGVLLFMGDRELMGKEDVPVADRAKHVRKVFERDGIFQRSNTRIVVEELVRDYDPNFDIPRDFKLYVAGGKVHLIRVIEKNDPSGRNRQSYYDRDWNFIDKRVRVDYDMGPAYEKPPHFDTLIEWGDRIARDLMVFYRLDFFLSPEGPVFGEFTSYPSAGRGYSRFGARLICDIQEKNPDYL